MNTLQRRGLLEALQDFGVDVEGTGVVFDEAVVPTLSLQNLTYNFAPAVRARGFSRIQHPAAGAGVFSGVTIRPNGDGLWLHSIQNNGATAAFVRFTTTAILTSVAQFNWDMIGDKPGEVRTGDPALDFFATAYRGTVGGVPAVEGGIYIPGSTTFQIQSMPVWVPGFTWVTVLQITANQACDVTLSVQFPSTNQGRLP